MNSGISIVMAIVMASASLAIPERAEARNVCKVFCGAATKGGKATSQLLRNPQVFKPRTGSLVTTRAATQIRVPNEARRVLAEVRKRKGANLRGYRGQAVYRNDPKPYTQRLPTHDHSGTITYKEYDLFPKAKGIDRGPHRLVVGSNGRAYYTPNHYATFVEMK